jgi:deazaflavin-dependent oxidoreductase (nitroreductase family)
MPATATPPGPSAPDYDYTAANPFERLVRLTAGWRPVAWFYARALDHLDRFTWRVTGGRGLFSAWLSGLPVLLLTTRGARTGTRRTCPLLGIPDGDGIVVIGSNYGQAHHPGWVFNLRAHPAVEVRFEGRERALVARELTGDERRAAWARAERVYPAWAAYRQRAAPRVIRVFRLEPAPPR